MGWYPITIATTVFLKIQSYGMTVVFDRYHDFSIKSFIKDTEENFLQVTTFSQHHHPYHKNL